MNTLHPKSLYKKSYKIGSDEKRIKPSMYDKKDFWNNFLK